MKIIHIVIIFVSVMLIVGTIAYIMIKNTDEKYTNNEQNIINKINTMTFDELLSTDLYFDVNQVNIEQIKNELYTKFRNKFKQINNIEDYDYSIRGDIDITGDQTLTKGECKEYNDSIGHTWGVIDDSTKPPGCFVSYGEKKIKWNTDTSKSCTPTTFCIRKRELTKLNDSSTNKRQNTVYNIVKTISLRNYNGDKVVQKYGYSVKHTANGIFCPYVHTNTIKIPSYIDNSNVGDYISINFATVSRNGQAINTTVTGYGTPVNTKEHTRYLGSMRAVQNLDNKKQYILYNITDDYVRIIRIEISVTSDNKLKFTKIGNEYYDVVSEVTTFVFDNNRYYILPSWDGYTYDMFDTISGDKKTPSVPYLVDNITFDILPQSDQISKPLPLYIYLHGGGDGFDNTDNFDKARVYKYIYTYDIEPAIVVSLRAINDSSNIHFSPDSFSLLDKIIIYFSCKFNVNLNRVYILGSSAGGDGVYNLSVRMPDLFAATHMISGHSNNISLKNLKNLPIYLTMGVLDNHHNRLSNVIDNYIQLKNLKYTTDLSILVHNVEKTDTTNNSSQTFYLTKINGVKLLDYMYYSSTNEKEKRIITHILNESGTKRYNYAHKKMIWKVNDINTFRSDFESFNNNILNDGNVKYNGYDFTININETKILIRDLYYKNIANQTEDTDLNSLDYFKNKFKTDVIKDNIIVDDIDDIRQVNKHSRSALSGSYSFRWIF